MNAVEIEEAVSELALQPFEAEEFPFSFLEAFGNKSTTIKKLRSGTSNKTDVKGAILQRNNIHILPSEKGRVSESLEVIRDSPSTRKN
nr:type IIL restriction-modification enzyme MmeI [Mesonia sp. K4-1]